MKKLVFFVCALLLTVTSVAPPANALLPTEIPTSPQISTHCGKFSPSATTKQLASLIWACTGYIKFQTTANRTAFANIRKTGGQKNAAGSYSYCRKWVATNRDLLKTLRR